MARKHNRDLAISFRRGLCVIARCQNQPMSIMGTMIGISKVFMITMTIIRFSITQKFFENIEVYFNIILAFIISFNLGNLKLYMILQLDFHSVIE